MIKMEHRGADTRGLPRTVRAVLIIGPDKKVKASMQYPLSVGVNFFEILRLLDALQVSSAESVHTPVNWVKVRSSHRNRSVLPCAILALARR